MVDSTDKSFVDDLNSLINKTDQRAGLPPAPIKPELPSTKAVSRESEVSRAGASGSVVAWPLDEKSRTEQVTTLISNNGLIEVDVADAIQITFTDQGGVDRVMNLNPPT